MKKRAKSASVAVPKVDPYIDGLMTKLLDRLTSLESKVDRLLMPKGPVLAPVTAPPRRERTLYEAICADCHKVCEVPFKPSEDRAVYCKDCFARRKSGFSAKPTPVPMPVAVQSKATNSSPVKKRKKKK